jgi:hypothetical protein
MITSKLHPYRFIGLISGLMSYGGLAFAGWIYASQLVHHHHITDNGFSKGAFVVNSGYLFNSTGLWVSVAVFVVGCALHYTYPRKLALTQSDFKNPDIMFLWLGGFVASFVALIIFSAMWLFADPTTETIPKAWRWLTVFAVWLGLIAWFTFKTLIDYMRVVRTFPPSADDNQEPADYSQLRDVPTEFLLKELERRQILVKELGRLAVEQFLNE